MPKRRLNLLICGLRGHGKSTVLSGILRCLGGRPGTTEVETSTSCLTIQEVGHDPGSVTAHVRSVGRIDGAIAVFEVGSIEDEEKRRLLVEIHEAGIRNLVIFLNKWDELGYDTELEYVHKLFLEELLEGGSPFRADELPMVAGSALLATGAMATGPAEYGRDAILKLLAQIDSWVDHALASGR